MKTLGIYGPKPAEQSAVANYITLSLPSLSRHFDCEVVSRYDLVHPSRFDYVLYQLSANTNTRHAHEALRQRAGPAIIHEHNFLELYYNLWNDLSDDIRDRILTMFTQKFRRTFQDIAEAQTFADMQPDMDRYSVDIGVEVIIMEHVTAVITHSPFIKDLLKLRYPQTYITVVPSMANPFTPAQATWAREQLGLNPDDFLFGVYGRIGEYKRVEQVIRGWQQWHDRPETAKLLILGSRQYEIDIPISKDLMYIDYIDDEGEFHAFMAAADCGVQLRHPTLGETSAVVSKMVANGKRLIISDTPYTAPYGKYENIVRVRPDDNEVQNLVTAFRRVIQLARLPLAYDQAYSPDSCTRRWAEIILSYSTD
jgi:glycosyltransferase involved in cell wall biosynthesis